MAVIGIGSAVITEGTSHPNDAAYGAWVEVEEGGVMYLQQTLLTQLILMLK